LPLIVSSIASGLRDMRGSLQGDVVTRRTDRDLPLATVFFGALALIVIIWAFLNLDPQTGGEWSWTAVFSGTRLLVNLAAAALIVLFGFLFVTVSSRLTGEIGSSSNPISGMTIATLLLTCLIFLVLGWTAAPYRLLALSIAAVVCIAASNGGTTSQDLKTGYLVGATPRWQQWAIVIGSVSSSIVIGAVLVVMNQTSTIYSTKNLPQMKQPLDMKAIEAAGHRLTPPNSGESYLVWIAPDDNPQQVPPAKYLVDEKGKIRYLVDPGISGKLSRRDDGAEVTKYNPPQAELFALITKGILSQKLPWTLVILGAAIAIVVELCGVSSLAFAVGVYLPLSSSAPICAGGLVRYFVERTTKKNQETASDLESEMSPGSLLSTGYIAGGTIAGVVIAFLNFAPSVIDALAAWQYRAVPVAAAATFDDQCRLLADSELGAHPSEKALNRLTGEIRDLNESLLRRYVIVPKGMRLNLPQDQTYLADEDTTLADVAKQKLGNASKASLLFDLNEEHLQLPKALPKDTLMRVPQWNAPALIAFALLAVFLVLVGRGQLLKTGSES
jgi:hypothetical protein